METFEDRLRRLEKLADNSSPNRKDVWDILSVIGGLLIPVAIFAVGQQYASRMAQAAIKSEEARSAGSLSVSKVGARVSQASFLLSSVETLAGADGPKKRLAIQALLIAFPEDGERIVREVSETDSSPEIRQFALQSLSKQWESSIQRLFTADSLGKREAADKLLQEGRTDKTLVLALLESAQRALNDPQTPGRDGGIYAILVVLSEVNPEALAPYEADLRRLAERARPMGERTSNRVDILLRRLSG